MVAWVLGLSGFGLLWLSQGVDAAEGTPSSADFTVTPSKSAGAYTVAWTEIAAAQWYKLTEVSGTTTTTYTVTGGATSRAFTGKSAGSYTYTLSYCFYLVLPFSEEEEGATGSTQVCGDSNYGSVTAFVNSQPSVGAIGAQSVAVGAAKTVSVSVTDADSAQTHTVSATSSKTSAATVAVSGKKITITGKKAGSATVSVTATDNSGASNAKSSAVTFKVTVTGTNSQPVVGSIANQTVAKGSTAQVAVSVSDADSGDTHTISASSDTTSVATVAVSGKKLTLTGVAAGSATISVTATDNSGASNAASAPQTFTVTVTTPNTNNRPVVGNIANQSVSNGSSAEVTVSVTDADSGDTHTIAAKSNKVSVATVSVSGKKLTIAGASRGSATITVTATDSSGASNATSAAQFFTVTVTNNRPLVGAIATQTMASGGTRQVAVAVTDADSGDTHSVSATSNKTDVATVTVSGKTLTVTGVSAGSATVTVTATDSSGASNATSSAQTFAVTVTSAGAGITVNPQTSDGAYTVSWTKIAVASKYKLTEVVGTTATTHSVQGSTTSKAFSGQSAGSYTYTLDYCFTTYFPFDEDDEGATGSSEVCVPSNYASATALVNSRPSVGGLSAVAVAVNGSSKQTISVADADSAQTHSIQASSDKTAVATVSVSGKTLTVRGVSAGSATITVTATDSSGAANATSTAQSFAVTVSAANNRPVVDSIADQAISAGGTKTVTVVVTDADSADTHTLSATSGKTSVATVSASGSTLTLTGVAAGSATITVTATDSSGASNATSAAVTFTATVTDPSVNGRPVVAAIANQSMAPAGTAQLTVAVTDPDSDDEHTVKAVSSDTSVATVSTSGKTLNLTGVAAGKTTVTVTAKDDSGEANATSEAVTFTVIVNTRPSVTAIAGQTVSAGNAKDVTVSVTDPDSGDAHKISAKSGNESVATVAVSGKTLTLTGVAAGSATISVTATDGSGASNAASAAAAFTVTVTAVNRPPTIGAIANRQLGMGYLGSLTVPVTDPDGDTSITVRATSASVAVATVSVSGTTLSFSGGAPGSTTISVTATDGKGATSTAQTFRVTVFATNGLQIDSNPNDTGSFKVTWPAHAADRYVLQESSDRGLTWRLAFDGNGGGTYFASGKAEGKYAYRIADCGGAKGHADDWRDTGAWPPTGCYSTGYSPIVTVDYPDETPIAPATTPGSLPYDTGVTKGGDAYINIPIAPIPGVNGLEPRISIDYSGGRWRQQANQKLPGDVLGYGWRLGGLSAIRRCVKGLPDGSKLKLKAADADDRLCLDGEPLVLVNGADGKAGAEYRTLRESYVKVVYKQPDAAKPGWFVASLPDGTVRQYGATEGSRLRLFQGVLSGGILTGMEPTLNFLWSLNRETDAFGNQMDIEYEKDEWAGVRTPRRISYGDGGDAEMCFDYGPRPDPLTTPLSDLISQSQNWRLHRIELRRRSASDGACGGTKVREYRFESKQDRAAKPRWWRLENVQLCGRGTDGTTDCLAPLKLAWRETAAELPYKAQTTVERLTDPLGRETRFAYALLTASDTDDFFPSGKDKPFGAGSAPSDAQALTALSGNAKEVVTEVKRGNGIGGFRSVQYAYQGQGWESTVNRGMLGFHATRETDDETGIVTYRRFRLDHPYEGRLSAVVRYDKAFGSSAKVLSERHIAYSKKEVKLASSETASTSLVYASATTDLIYEGETLLGAVRATETPTVESGLVTKLVRERKAHTSVTKGASSGTVWGSPPSFTLGGRIRRSATTLTFDNVTSGSSWLVGFVNKSEQDHYGSGSTADRSQRTDYTRYGNTSTVDAGDAVPERQRTDPEDGPGLRQRRKPQVGEGRRLGGAAADDVDVGPLVGGFALSDGGSQRGGPRREAGPRPWAGPGDAARGPERPRDGDRLRRAGPRGVAAAGVGRGDCNDGLPDLLVRVVRLGVGDGVAVRGFDHGGVGDEGGDDLGG